MTVEVDLRQVVYALADALDLVGVDDFYHGKRVALIAVECGRLFGLGQADLDLLFEAGLLHDCGVSSTRVHSRLVHEMDWSEAQDHCDRGSELLRGFPPLAHLAGLVLYHHTHWDRLAGEGADEHTALLSNLVFLADRVDSLAAPHYGEQTLLLAKEGIRATIAGYRGSLFAPQLLDAFLAISRNESFWFSLEPRHVQRYLAEMAQHGKLRMLSLAELRQMAQMFSHVVDAKSPFTVEHSQGVSRLARLLGELAGLPVEACDKLEVVGLLHDIGKLQVPDEILDKPAPLDAAERAVISRHSFESYQILRSISGLEDIARWAATHHEMPDGSGYPFHYRDKQLPLEARILSVADVFQALAQNRPYRASLPPGEILGHLREMGEIGHLDRTVVGLVEHNLNDCWRAAMAQAIDA